MLHEEFSETLYHQHIDTNHPSVVRDLRSKGLVNTDYTELHRSRAARGRVRHKRESYETQMNQMSQRLDRCEIMLVELIRHINGLVGRIEAQE